MKGLLVGAAVLLAATPAAAQRWVPLNFEADGQADYRIAYLNRDSVKPPSGNMTQMTVAYVYPKQQAFDSGTRYDWIEISFSVDCQGKTMRSTKTEAMLAGKSVATVTQPGPVNPFATTLALYRAALAACDTSGAEMAKMSQASPALLAAGMQRFRDRAALNASRSSTGWVRSGLGGPAGGRIALFLDRNSIVAEGNLRRVTMLTVSESPGASRFSMSRLEIDCTTFSRRQHVSLVFKTADEPIPIFPENDAVVMTPGTIFGSLRAPVCANDYTGKRAYTMLPDAIRPTAFAN